MAYNDSTRSHHHYYYINTDRNFHFILVKPGLLCPYVIPFPIPVDGYVHVWLLLSHLSSFVFMLDSITYFLYFTLCIFPKCSLVEGGPIYRVSICFQSMINLRKLTNKSTCSVLVNYLQACVLRYNRPFTYHCCKPYSSLTIAHVYVHVFSGT